MGIRQFFSRLIKPYYGKAILERLKRVDTFYLDFASLAHQAVGKVEGEWSEAKYFIALEKMIREQINDVNPRFKVVIAIDGIAPQGKQKQQAYRRYVHEQIRANKIFQLNPAQDELGKLDLASGFDTNQITPGTDFSMRLDGFLLSFVQDVRNQSLFRYEVVYSSHKDPGEGEHKIMEEIRKNVRAGESIVIGGMDADLILLSLLLPHQITLYRRDSRIDERIWNRLAEKYPKMSKRDLDRKATKETLEILDVAELRELMQADGIDINSFVFAVPILGNDFLPPQLGFNFISEIAEGFLEMIKGRNFFDSDSNLEMGSFLNFCNALLPLQERVVQIAGGKIPLRVRGDQNAYAKERHVTRTDRQDWNLMLTYYERDYQTASSDEERKEILADVERDIKTRTCEYLVTFIWNYYYYHDHKGVSQEWLYGGQWAPRLIDIVQLEVGDWINFYVKNAKRFGWTEYEFEEDGAKRSPSESENVGIEDIIGVIVEQIRKYLPLPYDLLGQMLLILPRNMVTKQPCSFLPEKARIFQTSQSPVYDFYPIRFDIYREGFLHADEGVPLLPFIDYRRFLTTYNENTALPKSLHKLYEPRALYRKKWEGAQRENLALVEIPRESRIVPVRSTNDRFNQKVGQLFGRTILEKTSLQGRLFSNIVPFYEQPDTRFGEVPIKVRNEYVS